MSSDLQIFSPPTAPDGIQAGLLKTGIRLIFGPSRAGRHVLARTHDAYNKAMAATDVLLDLREIMRAVGEPQAAPPVLREMPFLVLQQPLSPTIKLSWATGTLAPEFVGLADSVVDLYLEVLTRSAAEMLVRVVVHTEVYPAGLADSIGRLFLEIIRDGPERFEQRTAS